jgi:hypothetical protein
LRWSPRAAGNVTERPALWASDAVIVEKVPAVGSYQRNLTGAVPTMIVVST